MILRPKQDLPSSRQVIRDNGSFDAIVGPTIPGFISFLPVAVSTSGIACLDQQGEAGRKPAATKHRRETGKDGEGSGMRHLRGCRYIDSRSF